jgi:fumarate reductase flavoprotein subunit
MGSERSFDVIVVGGGLAGLTCAARLAQHEIRVVVTEAGPDERYPCNSRIASGSFNLAHSDPTLDAEHLRAAILGETDGTADPGLAAAVASHAGAAMQWLRQQGVRFIKVTRAGRDASWSMAPPRPATPGFGWQGRGPDLTLQCLAKALRANGGTMALATRAQRLLFEHGRCSGIAADHNGNATELRAPAVVLADGGFQGNAELVRRFISPRPESLVQRNSRSGKGDALLMAEAAGARLSGTDKFYGHLLAQDALSNDRLWPYPTIDTLASGAVVVDRSGRRFLDEGIGGVAMANVIARLDDPLGAVTVFDQGQWMSLGRSEFTPPNPYVETCGGSKLSAPSIGELADALAVPRQALVDTINGYNSAIASGEGSALSPPRSPGRLFSVLKSSAARSPLSPINEPPFHAIRLAAGLTYTMGGIAINARTEVIGRDGKALPGLYAVGACTGGLEGGPLAGYIGGLCKALSLGFIAAETLTANQHAD